MAWNFLNSLLERLHLELALLVLALAWLPVRLLQVVVKRAENGRPIAIRLLGREFVAVENLSLDHQHGERSTSRRGEERRTPRVSARIRHAVGSDILAKDNPMSSEKAGKQDLSQKNQLDPHENDVGGGTKWQS